MEIRQEGDHLRLCNCSCFHIGQTLSCGQWFRYMPGENNTYTLIAFGKRLCIQQVGQDILFFNTCMDEWQSHWCHFFDMNQNYEEIQQTLSKSDPIMGKAIAFAPGIHILNQEFEECLLSFILSQNRKIPMIQQSIEHICTSWGSSKPTEGSRPFFAFPNMNQLMPVQEDAFRLAKAGFRAPYLCDAIRNLCSKKISEKELATLSTQDAQSALMQIRGVGPKVADCVLLFSLGRREVFPADVWITRVMRTFYFQEKAVPLKEIQAFAKEKFGPLAGYAQQYLFFYARSLGIR